MKTIKLQKFLKENIFNLKWTCNCCGCEIFNDSYFCSACENSFLNVKVDKCNHCGRRTYEAVLFCDSCTNKNLQFDTARSVYEYCEPINSLIKAFKYDGKKYLAEVFASKMLNVLLSNFSDANLITFVPMTKSREATRGYNQSELLANELSLLTGIEVKETALKKYETKRQANLSAKERKINLKNSFKVLKSVVKDKNVLIIDDVLTTGYTADVLAEGFKKAGANYVYVLTIASVSFLNDKI